MISNEDLINNLKNLRKNHVLYETIYQSGMQKTLSLVGIRFIFRNYSGCFPEGLNLADIFPAENYYN